MRRFIFSCSYLPDETSTDQFSVSICTGSGYYVFSKHSCKTQNCTEAHTFIIADSYPTTWGPFIRQTRPAVEV